MPAQHRSTNQEQPLSAAAAARAGRQVRRVAYHSTSFRSVHTDGMMWGGTNGGASRGARASSLRAVLKPGRTVPCQEVRLHCLRRPRAWHCVARLLAQRALQWHDRQQDQRLEQYKTVHAHAVPATAAGCGHENGSREGGGQAAACCEDTCQWLLLPEPTTGQQLAQHPNVGSADGSHKRLASCPAPGPLTALRPGTATGL